MACFDCRRGSDAGTLLSPWVIQKRNLVCGYRFEGHAQGVRRSLFQREGKSGNGFGFPSLVDALFVAGSFVLAQQRNGNEMDLIHEEACYETLVENELHLSPFKSVTHVAVVTATGNGRVTITDGGATSKGPFRFPFQS